MISPMKRSKHSASVTPAFALALLITATQAQTQKPTAPGEQAETKPQEQSTDKQSTGKQSTGKQPTKEQQAKGSTDESVEELLTRVARTIRKEGAPDKLRSFRAKVSANVRAQGSTAKIDVTIDYLTPVYLRTRIRESGKECVRGRGRGLVPWMKLGTNKSYLLQGKEYESDRRAVARDLAIAAGMTRFLYPDRVLKRLHERIAKPIADELPWRRGKTIPAFRVEGIAKDGSDYPLAATPGHEGPIRVRAWFDRKSLALIAILLEPLADLKTRRPVGRMEELRFLEHVAKDGLLLPKKILLRIEDRQAKPPRMRTSQSVELVEFRANPLVLNKAYFKRPE